MKIKLTKIKKVLNQNMILMELQKFIFESSLIKRFISMGVDWLVPKAVNLIMLGKNKISKRHGERASV